jgi:ribosome maturation factor RimP
VQASKGKKRPAEPEPVEEPDDNVIYLDDEDDEEGGWYEDEEFEEDEEDFGEFAIGTEEDPGPEILTGNVPWGDAALQVAEAVLKQRDMQGLQLYLFRVLPPSMKIEIRLDKLEDLYGSPSIDDISSFSRKLYAGLEAELGAEQSGQITLEVSSPGAERQLILPQDLTRFQDLPMKVEYMNNVGQLVTLVLQFLGLDEAEGNSLWALADVKVNAPTKGRGLSKKQREQRFDIPISALERVRIYVDM